MTKESALFACAEYVTEALDTDDGVFFIPTMHAIAMSDLTDGDIEGALNDPRVRALLVSAMKLVVGHAQIVVDGLSESEWEHYTARANQR